MAVLHRPSDYDVNDCAWVTAEVRPCVLVSRSTTRRVPSARTNERNMAATYLAAERRVAIEAVQAACSITTKVFQSLVSSESITKKDKSPVTIGDYSAQAAVNKVLAQHFPDDGIVGEEDSADLQGEKGTDLRGKVSHLVNESLQEHGHIQSPLSDSQLLQSIDLGSFAGGSSKRTSMH